MSSSKAALSGLGHPIAQTNAAAMYIHTSMCMKCIFGEQELSNCAMHACTNEQHPTCGPSRIVHNAFAVFFEVIRCLLRALSIASQPARASSDSEALSIWSWN